MSAPNLARGGLNPEEQERREQERRDDAIRRAMLDDLGVQRLEELPPATDGVVYATQPTRGRRVPTINAVWQAAMHNGTFEDDDAEAVRGLEALSGRLYDNRVSDNSRPGSRPIHARHPGNTGRPAHPGQPIHTGRPTIQVADRRTRQVVDMLNQSNVQNSPQRRRRRNNPTLPPTPPTPQRARGGTNNIARGGPPSQRLPTPTRPPRPAPPARSPLATMERAPFPEVEPHGYLFRSSIVFCDAATRQRVPACVYLVSAKTQDSKYFVIYILGQEFFRIPVAQTDNTTTSSEGGEYHVMISFKSQGKILSYLLTFQTQELQEAFVNTERALRNKTAPPTEDQRSTSEAIPLPSQPSQSRGDDGTSIIAGSSSLTVNLPTPSIPNSAAPTTPFIPTTVTHATPAPAASATVNGLIDLDTEEEDEGAGGPSSSATELLATLDPIVYQDLEDEADNQEPQPAVEPTEMIRIQYRLIRSVLGHANMNKAAAERAIRNAFAIYLPSLFPDLDQSQLERLSAEVIDSETEDRTPRRISYSPSEMFDLREDAVDPPAYLYDLDYLPKVGSGQRTQQAEPISPFRGGYDQSGIARTTAAFSWAMGVEAGAVPETTTATNSAEVLPSHGSGLRGSLWADGAVHSRGAAGPQGPLSPQVSLITPASPSLPVAASMAALAPRSPAPAPHPATRSSTRLVADTVINTTPSDEIKILSANLSRLTIGNKRETDQSSRAAFEVTLTSTAPQAATSTPQAAAPSPVQTAALRFVAAEVAVAVPGPAQTSPARAKGLRASRHAR